jgi:hypothetical protein
VHLRYPTRHRRRWQSTNLLERSLGEVKRRTKVMGRFPGEESCLTLVWDALAGEAGDGVGESRGDCCSADLADSAGASSVSITMMFIAGVSRILATWWVSRLVLVTQAQSGGPEDLRDAAVGVRGAADQLQTLRVWEAVHQREALAESHRVDRQAVLVDQAVADQAVRDAGAAEDDQVLARLALERRDLLLERSHPLYGIAALCRCLGRGGSPSR